MCHWQADLGRGGLVSGQMDKALFTHLCPVRSDGLCHSPQASVSPAVHRTGLAASSAALAWPLCPSFSREGFTPSGRALPTVLPVSPLRFDQAWTSDTAGLESFFCLGPAWLCLPCPPGLPPFAPG